MIKYHIVGIEVSIHTGHPFTKTPNQVKRNMLKLCHYSVRYEPVTAAFTRIRWRDIPAQLSQQKNVVILNYVQYVINYEQIIKMHYSVLFC